MLFTDHKYGWHHNTCPKVYILCTEGGTSGKNAGQERGGTHTTLLVCVCLPLPVPHSLRWFHRLYIMNQLAQQFMLLVYTQGCGELKQVLRAFCEIYDDQN